MMLPMLMLILFYEFILKSKFSTQSCVRCAFLFNVDKSWLYELWWVWTQWWQAWNWFPLCNSSDQINQFALHCWFDLRWSSDCQGHCHHCIGSMFNDLSILTPLFIHDCQTDLEFYFILNLVCAVLRACSCVCPVFITTTQPICLHASFYQPQDNMVNAISCKWWILNTQRSLNMVHRIGTFCHSRIWFHFVNAYLLDVLLKFHWSKNFDLNKTQHSISEFWREKNSPRNTENMTSVWWVWQILLTFLNEWKTEWMNSRCH